MAGKSTHTYGNRRIQAVISDFLHRGAPGLALCTLSHEVIRSAYTESGVFDVVASQATVSRSTLGPVSGSFFAGTPNSRFLGGRRLASTSLSHKLVHLEEASKTS